MLLPYFCCNFDEVNCSSNVKIRLINGLNLPLLAKTYAICCAWEETKSKTKQVVVDLQNLLINQVSLVVVCCKFKSKTLSKKELGLATTLTFTGSGRLLMVVVSGGFRGGGCIPPTSLKVTILAEKSASVSNNSAPFRDASPPTDLNVTNPAKNQSQFW